MRLNIFLILLSISFDIVNFFKNCLKESFVQFVMDEIYFAGVEG